MKKWLFSSCILMFSTTIWGLPSNNPANPGIFCRGFLEDECRIWPGLGFFQDKCFNLRLGFYGDYVYNRHLQIDSSSDDSDIRTVELYTNAGEVTLNLWNRLDIYATFGATNLSLAGATGAFQPSATGGNDTFIINSATDISYSVGARGILWQCGHLYVGASGQYFTTSPEVTSVISTFSSFVTTYVDDIYFNYHEWQVSGGIAYRACFACGLEIIPYVNLIGGCVHVTFDNPTVELNTGGGGNTDAFTATLLNLKNQHSFGYALGITLLGSERASIGIEGRFSNQKALFFNVQFRL